jgi:hypothetical protein
MLNFLKKEKRLKSLLLLLVVFSVFNFSAPTMAAEDNYMGGKSVVSQSFSDPTKTSNSEYASGLQEVPGITVLRTPKPEDVSGLNQRISQDKQTISGIISVKESLQTEKEKADAFVASWNIANQIPVGNPSSVRYNRTRLLIIKNMMDNADLKIKWLESDIGACSAKIDDIGLKAAQASGNPAQIEAAQARVVQTNKELRDTRIDIQQKLAEIKTMNDASCWPGGSFTPNIGNCILIGTGWIGNIITWISALLLWVASKLFDMSVYISISLIRLWFEAGMVQSAWIVIRDLSNLFFVFILLYIAIGTIFDLGGVSDPKKMVTNVVIIALLVNFSGFFVRVIVDASNIVAYEFYAQMGGGGVEVSTIGTKLVQKMDLGSYFIDAETLKKAGDDSSRNFVPPVVERLSFISIISGTLGNMLIILATAIVLLIASALFIIRTIILLIIYILSPLAFVSRIIPSKKFNKFDEWLETLVKYSLLAPAFLIPLYLVFIILGPNGISHLAGTSGWGLIGGGSLTLIMIDILILGLVTSCLFIAQKVSNVGAEATPGFATKAKQMLSRPLSRYGGRIANRVGAGIAGSSVGKAASKSWNEGNLRLVRRSWDTGVLRTARESEYGKRAGQAIRNPLTTALGVQPFSVDERAKSILSDVKNLETDAQKSRFVEGLAGFRGKEEFDYIYNNMGTDSVKVESAARKILADSSASAGAKKGAQMVADRMAENRKKLTGKKAQDIAAEMVKSSKEGVDKVAAVSSLKPEDLNGMFKNLSREERVELEKAVKASGNAALIANLGTAATKLKTGDATALKTATEAEAAYDGVVAAMAVGATTPLVTDDIRKISREKVVELAPRILTDPGISQHLTTVQLEAIRNSDLVDDINKDIIRTNIEGEVRAARAAVTAGIMPRIPRNLEKLDKYFNGGAGSGF